MNWLKNKWLALWKSSEISNLQDEVKTLTQALSVHQATVAAIKAHLDVSLTNLQYAQGGFVGRRALGRFGERASDQGEQHKEILDAIAGHRTQVSISPDFQISVATESMEAIAAHVKYQAENFRSTFVADRLNRKPQE